MTPPDLSPGRRALPSDSRAFNRDRPPGGLCRRDRARQPAFRICEVRGPGGARRQTRARLPFSLGRDTAMRPVPVPPRSSTSAPVRASPGFPLRLRSPGLSFTLLERMERRAVFLKTCVVLLGLSTRVKVIRGDLVDLDGAVRRRHLPGVRSAGEACRRPWPKRCSVAEDRRI